MTTHCATSATVRPQPRHIASKVVEQTATHGVSGRLNLGGIRKESSSYECEVRHIDLEGSIGKEILVMVNWLMVDWLMVDWLMVDW